MSGDVQIIEVDPHDPANESLLHAMYDVSAAARADRPFEVWAPWSTAYTTWTSPSEHQTETLWAARSGGEVVGTASVGLPLLDNQHAAHVEFFVHPDHRRRTIGSLLLDTVVEHARAAGRTVVLASPYSP